MKEETNEGNFFLYDPDAKKEFLRLFCHHAPIGPLTYWRLILLHDELQRELKRKFPLSFIMEMLEELSDWQKVERKQASALKPSALLKWNSEKEFDHEVRSDQGVVIHSPTKKARSPRGSPARSEPSKGTSRSLRRR
jgi:hypothetical protein